MDSAEPREKRIEELIALINAERERQVPTNVLYKMIKNFEVPCYQEGWDDIQIVWFDYKEHKLNFNLRETDEIEHGIIKISSSSSGSPFSKVNV